jgi:hypothetical protein
MGFNMMDAETVRWVLTGLAGIVMWYWKRGIDSNEKAIDLLKAEIQGLKDTRLHKDDFRDFKNELRLQFEDLKAAIRDSKFHAS